MKPIAIVAGVIAAGLLAALLVGVFVFAWITPTSMEPAAYSMSTVAAAPTEERGSRLMALEAELAMVSDRLAELTEQVGELSRAPARRSVPPEEATHASAQPTEPAAGLGISAADREAVVEILASVRAEEQQRRDEARLEREEERAAERAAEIAKELGLSLADEVALGDHLVEASTKRSELMAQVREEGFDPGTMRASFMEQREWNDEQLQTLFGENLAGQIQQLERENRGGFRGFGGRGGTEGQETTTRQGARGGR